jgi:hypothetical protein
MAACFDFFSVAFTFPSFFYLFDRIGCQQKSCAMSFPLSKSFGERFLSAHDLVCFNMEMSWDIRWFFPHGKMRKALGLSVYAMTSCNGREIPRSRFSSSARLMLCEPFVKTLSFANLDGCCGEFFHGPGGKNLYDQINFAM